MENSLAFFRSSNYILQNVAYSIEADAIEDALFLPKAEILQCPWPK